MLFYHSSFIWSIVLRHCLRQWLCHYSWRVPQTFSCKSFFLFYLKLSQITLMCAMRFRIFTPIKSKFDWSLFSLRPSVMKNFTSLKSFKLNAILVIIIHSQHKFMKWILMKVGIKQEAQIIYLFAQEFQIHY